MGVSALLGLKTNMGVYGVAAGYSGGIILAAGGLYYRWQYRIKPEAIQEHQKNLVSRKNTCQIFSSFFKRPSDHNNLRPDNEAQLNEGLLDQPYRESELQMIA